MGLTGPPGSESDGEVNRSRVAAAQRFFEGTAAVARLGAIHSFLPERGRQLVVTGTGQQDLDRQVDHAAAQVAGGLAP